MWTDVVSTLFFILMEKTKLNIYMNIVYRRTLNYIEWSMKVLWVYNESDK